MDNNVVTSVFGGPQQVNPTSVPNNEIGNNPITRTLPRQMSTGVLRGTQNVGYGGVQIDGSNNRIVLSNITNISSSISASVGTINPGVPGDQSFGLGVTNATGLQLTVGILKDGTLGMNVIDGSGFVLFEMNGQTWFWYDKNTNKNVMQVGLLPDGSFGWCVAKTGFNVADGF